MAFCPVHTKWDQNPIFTTPPKRGDEHPRPFYKGDTPPNPPPPSWRYRRNLTKGLGCVHTIPDSSFCAGAKVRPDTGLLFTRKNGDFIAVSVTERSCVALIFKAESRIIIAVRNIPDCFLWRHEKTSGMLRVSFSFVCGTGQGQNWTFPCFRQNLFASLHLASKVGNIWWCGVIGRWFNTLDSKIL